MRWSASQVKSPPPKSSIVRRSCSINPVAGTAEQPAKAFLGRADPYPSGGRATGFNCRHPPTPCATTV